MVVKVSIKGNDIMMIGMVMGNFNVIFYCFCVSCYKYGFFVIIFRC